MKKIFIIALSIIALLFVSNFIYKTYKRYQRTTQLTDDRAVIFAYINLKPEDFKEYFDLTDTDYDEIKDNYELKCVAEDEEDFNVINNRLNYDTSKINCDVKFNFETQFELSKKDHPYYFSLYIRLKNTKTGKRFKKQINTTWKYGRINHIVINKEGAYLHCTN